MLANQKPAHGSVPDGHEIPPEEEELRDLIRRRILEQPGVGRRELREWLVRKAGFRGKRGDIGHHLVILEQAGEVKVYPYGRVHRYYPSEVLRGIDFTVIHEKSRVELPTLSEIVDSRVRITSVPRTAGYSVLNYIAIALLALTATMLSDSHSATGKWASVVGTVIAVLALALSASVFMATRRPTRISSSAQDKEFTRILRERMKVHLKRTVAESRYQRGEQHGPETQ